MVGLSIMEWQAQGKRQTFQWSGILLPHNQKSTLNLMNTPTQQVETVGDHGETSEELATAERLADLLWDSLKRDPEHKDRRRTAYGTKTKLGLLRTVQAVINNL